MFTEPTIEKMGVVVPGHEITDRIELCAVSCLQSSGACVGLNWTGASERNGSERKSVPQDRLLKFVN